MKHISTEKYGLFSVEHRTLRAADGIPLSITHILGNKNKQPIVLLHGSYSTRSFWISERGIGFGAYLSELGYDVWIPEFRGHGLSPKGEKFKHYSAEQQMKYDLPAFGRFVYEQTSQAAVWMGHSFGGLSLYGSLSQSWLSKSYVRGLITMGSQVSEGDSYLKLPFVPFVSKQLLKILGKFPAKALGLGPENEAIGVILDVIEWKKRGGSWQSREGKSYWRGFSNITQPSLVISSIGDETDPAEGCKFLYEELESEDKTYVLLGIENGFAQDYDHVGMVITKDAQNEVWPLIGEWISRRFSMDLPKTEQKHKIRKNLSESFG